MKVSSVAATTSSRLNRERELPPDVETQLNVFSTMVIDYCHKSLERSRFFRLLKNEKISLPIMKYAFLQYRFWRDRLHQWFGLCIVKAGSCTDPEQKVAIMSLADHIFTDLQDDHSEMYLEFLHDLGLSKLEIQASQPSIATTSYQRSFFNNFGYETANFYEALAGLSGRELAVSVRNEIILRCYFDAHQLKRPTWLALHAELEVDHFHDAIRPGLSSYAGDSAKLAKLMKAIERSIDQHIEYFDEMLDEYECQA